MNRLRWNFTVAVHYKYFNSGMYANYLKLVNDHQGNLLKFIYKE